MRFETLTAVGLGKEAVAIVETRDEKRSIVTDGAVLVLRRSPRTLFLSSRELPARDRAAALTAFETLGRIATKRLD